MRSVAEPAAELDARYSNEEAKPTERADALTPAVVYAFGKGEPFTHTRWRFGGNPEAGPAR